MEQLVDFSESSPLEWKHIAESINWNDVAPVVVPKEIPKSTLLTDQSLNKWPERDNRSIKIHRDNWTLYSWSFQIKLKQMNLHTQLIVIYLSRLHQIYKNSEQLDNAMWHLSKSIKKQKPHSSLLYFSPLLVASSPLQDIFSLQRFAQLMEKIARDLNRKLHPAKFIHTSEALQDWQSLDKLLTEDYLSTKGCLMFRSKVMASMGILPEPEND